MRMDVDGSGECKFWSKMSWREDLSITRWPAIPQSIEQWLQRHEYRMLSWCGALNSFEVCCTADNSQNGAT
jgi:hypothetical protein